MDSDSLKKMIMKNKSRGVIYIHEHYELIKNLLDSGENPGSIYVALKESQCPPPISRSQFYRHLKKYQLTHKSLDDDSPSPPSPASEIVNPIKQNADPKHAALSNLKKTTKPIHDSGIDADKLI